MSRILGAPSRVKTQRFDIEAKVAEADVPKLDKLTVEQRGLMLRPLLEDRFNLKFHQETKDLPVDALVIAKGGSKMKQSTSDNPIANGLRLMGAGHLESKGVSIEFLAQVLSRQLGRSVLDETGLTGKYDYTLEWLPDAAPPMAGGGESGQPGNLNAPPPDSSGSSLFTALQEQLGLKLESQKGPVSVIVIDHIEEPSPN
jgi:bla regulator protein blaR1